MSLELELTPVYYRVDIQSPVSFPGLPENSSPYAHQLQTYCAVARTRDYEQASTWCHNCELIAHCQVARLNPLSQHGILCITNSAITGGGKTLAAYAYAVEHCLSGHKVMGVYPTNELLHDQKRAVCKLFYQIYKRPPTEGIDGELLVVDAEFLRQEKQAGEPNIKLIEYILTRAKIVLTNPDILYLLCHHLYASSREMTGRNISTFTVLMRDFRTIIFDEFHLYNIKQQASVVWLVGLSAQLFANVETAKPHSFIFSSATPLNENTGFGQRLASLSKFGISTVSIQQPGDSYGRPVMEVVKLRFESANLQNWEGEDKAVDLLSDIQVLLAESPEHRCLYVMDAVATARRLKKELADLFGNDKVGEAHGLVRPEEKRSALKKAHTTGTSGIEVGIDFTDEYFKDVLLFEARTSAQFLQRLGRIGRNGRQGAKNYAIAIVPPEVLAYFQEYPQLPEQLDRTRLPLIIKDAFRYFDPEAFNRYLDLYAPLEAEYTCKIYLKGFEYGKNPVTGKYEETQERKLSKEQLSHLLQTLYPCYNREATGKELRKLLCNGTISGILGFRDGGSVVEGNIYRSIGFQATNGKSIGDYFAPLINLEIPYFDLPKSQMKDTFPFHTYSLTYLLRRTQCRFADKSEFWQILEKYQQFPEAVNYRKQLEQGEPMLYAIFYGDLSQPRRWHFHSDSGSYRYYKFSDGDIKQEKRDNQPVLDKVQRIKGLSVELEKTDHSLDLDLLNQALMRRDAIAYIGVGNSFNIAREKHLPPLFELSELRWGASQARYYITFDLNAFFLNSLNAADKICIV